MNAISYSSARSNLSETMDRVCSDHTPVIITRHKRSSVVMLSLEDFQALEETAYLLRNPKNAERLLSSVDEMSQRRGKAHTLTGNKKP